MATFVWTGTTSTLWSVGSNWNVGGVAQAASPTAADDVAVGTGTGATNNALQLDLSFPCRSLDFTGYTGTFTHLATKNLQIGDATAGAGNIALKFVAGMTYALGSTTTSLITFATTAGTVQTIDFAGKITGNVTFSALISSYKYLGTHNTGTAATVTHSSGVALDTNGQTCSWGLYSNNNNGARTLTLGASNITITGVGTAWNVAGVLTSFTVTANTATVTMTGAAATFSGSKDFNGMTLIMSGSGTMVMASPATFAAFSRICTASKTDILSLNSSFIVTGAATFTSNSSVNRLLIQSGTLGTSRSVTAATVVVNGIVDFMDINGQGAATWTVAGTGATALGDCGGNSNITFSAAVTQNITISTNKNMSDVTIYTSRVPLPQDDITTTGVTGGVLTADMPRIGRSIDWTGATGAPQWGFSSISTTIFGSVTLIAGMTIGGGNALTFGGRGTFTITSAGVSYTNQHVVAAPGGTYTLQDVFSANSLNTSNFSLTNGSFVTNNFNVTTNKMSASGTGTRALTLGTSTWTIIGMNSGVLAWDIGTTTGLTFSGASSTVVLSNVSTTAKTFQGGGLTYGTVTHTVSGSTGTEIFTGSNTFTNINASDASNARTTQFTAATTTTITGNFSVNGSSGKLMSVQSVTAATHTLSKASGVVSCDYLSLTNSIATGGATWYAGANSVDNGGNTGWIFTAPPSNNSNFFLMF